MATTYGVHRDSILNESKYFHVTEGLVPDVMHDVLEGCAPLAIKQLLNYLDHNAIVTIREVTDQIQHFLYVPLDARNKPTVIPGTTFSSSDNTLKQKGQFNFDNDVTCIQITLIIRICSWTDVVSLQTPTFNDSRQGP